MDKQALEVFVKKAIREQGLPDTPETYYELGAKFIVPAIQKSDADLLTIAMYCYEVAAKAGHSGGQAGLASAYSYKKDWEQVKYWAQKSAEQGNPQGMSGLGLYYMVKVEYDKAEKWLQKALDAGCTEAAGFMQTVQTVKSMSQK